LTFKPTKLDPLAIKGNAVPMDVYEGLSTAMQGAAGASREVVGRSQRMDGLRQLEEKLGPLHPTIVEWFSQALPANIAWISPFSANESLKRYNEAFQVHDELVDDPIFAGQGREVRDFLPLGTGIEGHLSVCLTDPVPWISYYTLGYASMPIVLNDGPHQHMEPRMPGPGIRLFVATLALAIGESRLVWNSERNMFTSPDGDAENPWADYPWGWNVTMELPKH